jgi:hypothetical protein
MSALLQPAQIRQLFHNRCPPCLLLSQRSVHGLHQELHRLEIGSRFPSLLYNCQPQLLLSIYRRRKFVNSPAQRCLATI